MAHQNVTHIALFGSSFNPPHTGHFSVLKALVKKNLFDEIWLVPVYKHPFAKNLWPYALRLQLAKLLLQDVGKELPNKKSQKTSSLFLQRKAIGERQSAKIKIKICEIEKILKKKTSYMIDTVTALQKKFPRKKITLILGSDCKKDLSKWHRIDELKTLVDFYFIPRRGFEKSPFPEVSSTEVRTRLEEGKSIRGMVTKSIENYITKVFSHQE